MSVTLMTLSHAAEATRSVEDERGVLASSFAAHASDLLRYWNVGGSSWDHPAGHLLVIGDAPDLLTSAELVSEVGMRLEAFTPVSVSGVSPRDAYDALTASLPEELPDALRDMRYEEPGSAVESIVGIKFCPRCGGWGEHFRPPCG